MAKRKGQVVFNTLVTPDSTITFPIADINDIKGGRHYVANNTARNNLPTSHLKAGMVVFVEDTKKEYQLKAGFPASGPTTDANWQEYAPGVPTGILTAHQKLEDIEYNTPTSEGFTTLVQKLASIDTKIAGCLTSHQKVEDIVYNDPSVSGYNTLTQKLAALESSITAAGAVPHIEDINWLNKPTSPDTHGHATNLGDELEAIWTNMNDPTKIRVTRHNGTTTWLNTYLDELETDVPTVEDISNSAGTALTTLLTDASDITKIKYSPTVTLKEKIDSINAAAGAPTVETITWGTAPSTPAGINSSLAQNIKDLFTAKLDMNDPSKISIPAGTVGNANAEDLTTALADLKSAIASAGTIPTVEQIKWGTTPSGTGRNQNLSTEIDTLFTRTANVNDPAYITIPAGTIGASQSTDKDLVAALSDLASSIGNISGATGNVNDPAYINIPASTYGNTAQRTLLQALNDIHTEADKHVEDITWNTAPTTTSGNRLTVTRSADLNTELNNIVGALEGLTANNITTPANTYNSNAAESLSASLTAIYAAASGAKSSDDINVAANKYGNATVGTVTAAIEALYDLARTQIILFNTSAPETGPLVSQEFLTDAAGVITDITTYVNSDATIANTGVEVQLQKWDGSAYSALDANATGSISAGAVIGTNTLATPITVPANTRIRMNVTTFDSGNSVNVLNVRVTFKKN